jgi:hypothetical protein
LCKMGKGIIVPGFTIYCNVIVFKIPWYCHQNRHINQWNRIASLEINSSFIVNWFSTNVSRMHCGGRTVFNKWN